MWCHRQSKLLPPPPLGSTQEAPPSDGWGLLCFALEGRMALWSSAHHRCFQAPGDGRLVVEAYTSLGHGSCPVSRLPVLALEHVVVDADQPVSLPARQRGRLYGRLYRVRRRAVGDVSAKSD